MSSRLSLRQRVLRLPLSNKKIKKALIYAKLRINQGFFPVCWLCSWEPGDFEHFKEILQENT